MRCEHPEVTERPARRSVEQRSRGCYGGVDGCCRLHEAEKKPRLVSIWSRPVIDGRTGGRTHNASGCDLAHVAPRYHMPFGLRVSEVPFGGLFYDRNLSYCMLTVDLVSDRIDSTRLDSTRL